MLSSRCEQNASVGIFTRSESHFLYDSFFISSLYWLDFSVGCAMAGEGWNLLLEGEGNTSEYCGRDEGMNPDGLTKKI